ncbi:MAG: hypothetical protein ACM3OO_10075 [Planctomycetaceae bacterium]
MTHPPFRVTVLADRWPAGGSTTERAVALLTALEPSVRVTVAAREVAEAEALRARDVEVVVCPTPPEGARWLAARAGHPNVLVIDGPAAALAFLGSLDAHPGAALLYDLRGPATGDHLLDRRVEIQVAALASVVLVPSPAFVPFVRELGRGGDAVVAEGDDRRALAQAFALTGLAVPDAALA